MIMNRRPLLLLQTRLSIKPRMMVVTGFNQSWCRQIQIDSQPEPIRQKNPDGLDITDARHSSLFQQQARNSCRHLCRIAPCPTTSTLAKRNSPRAKQGDGTLACHGNCKQVTDLGQLRLSLSQYIYKQNVQAYNARYTRRIAIC